MSEYCKDNLFPGGERRILMPIRALGNFGKRKKVTFYTCVLVKTITLSPIYLLVTVIHKLLDPLRKKPRSLCTVFVCRGGRLTKRLKAKYQNVSRKFLALLCYSLASDKTMKHLKIAVSRAAL